MAKGHGYSWAMLQLKKFVNLLFIIKKLSIKLQVATSNIQYNRPNYNTLKVGCYNKYNIYCIQETYSLPITPINNDLYYQRLNYDLCC